MEKFRRLAALGAVFTLSLCVLGLGPVFLLVEYNIRETVYGQVDPGMAFSLEEGLPVLTDTATGQPMTLLDDRQLQGVTALLPPGVRAVLGLLRRETEAVSHLLSWPDG